MKMLKKYYGSKAKAREAAYLIRKLNEWIRYANAHKGWADGLYKEVRYGIHSL